MSSAFEISRQPFKDFLKSSDESVAKAVALSEEMKSDLERFGDIKQSLASVVHEKAANIHFYGSRVIGTAKAGSDLDIYVEICNSFSCGISIDAQKLYLKDFKDKLSENTEWNIDIAVYDATVPVLHLTYVPRNIKCRISVSDGLCVVNSKLLAHLFAINSNAVKLYHFIRLWLKCGNVEFKGYQLTLLVLFFLQTRNFVPSMKRVRRDLPLKKIKGWPIQFNESHGSFEYLLSPWVHFNKSVLRFFEFYRKFDYENKVIFTKFGLPIEKTSFAGPQFKKFPKSVANCKVDTPMVIVGPLAFDYNVGQDVSATKLEMFKSICQLSNETFLNLD